MHKLGVAVTDEIFEALTTLSRQRSGAPISNIVREYIIAGLERDGIEIADRDMRWGGRRVRASGDPAPSADE